MPIVKRKISKEYIIYELTKDHNDNCKKHNIIKRNIEDNTIHNYKEYVKQCRY